MADLIVGSTQLDSTKNEIIAALVQRELSANAKLVPTITDVSTYAVKGAKSISFPKLTPFTVINRTSGAAGDASQLTASTDKLDLDYNAYVAWIIDSFDEMQTSIEAQLEFAKRAASAHARYVDSAIIAELETVGVASHPAGAITRDGILQMREDLLVRNADPNAITLAISPYEDTSMLKISQFTEAQIYGTSNVPAGIIGSVYGVPLLVSNLLSSGQFFMYGREGCAIGFQKAPSMSEQGANEYGTGAKRFAMDQLFGVKGMQLGVNGVLASESALVVKDSN